MMSYWAVNQFNIERVKRFHFSMCMFAHVYVFVELSIRVHETIFFRFVSFVELVFLIGSMSCTSSGARKMLYIFLKS